MSLNFKAPKVDHFPPPLPKKKKKSIKIFNMFFGPTFVKVLIKLLYYITFLSTYAFKTINDLILLNS
jgi:hypothetical protein